ncbi:hypothetical protein Tco_0354187, partial [Tanacetum coccineum]
NGYFKDEIDLGQLGSHMDKLMDEDKAPNPKDMSTNTKSVPAKVKGSEKGSLWEQFLITHSTSQPKSSMSYTNDSDEDEVYMLDVIPGGGFLDGMKDDLDCYDGYEAQVYDISKKKQVFCDQYDICLNRHCRK